MPWFMIWSYKKMGSSKDHFLDFRVSWPGSQKYFCEYLCENENILGYCSRAQVLSIHAERQSSKISCCRPFKTLTGETWSYIKSPDRNCVVFVRAYKSFNCKTNGVVKVGPWHGAIFCFFLAANEGKIVTFFVGVNIN